MAAKDVNTLEYREMKENDPMTNRTENNPLRDQGFWTSPWSVKVKIMRQLVDWNRTSGHTDSLAHDIELIIRGPSQSRTQMCTTSSLNPEQKAKWRPPTM